jgi:chaperonin GroEL (HSP60 family)
MLPATALPLLRFLLLRKSVAAGMNPMDLKRGIDLAVEAVVSEDLGIKLENVTLNMLGRAKKVMIDKENTTIVNGAGKKADIEARVN